MTTNLSSSSHLEKAARAAKLDHIGKMALGILYEMSLGEESSSWAPYLRVLPSLEEMNLPMTWDDTEEETGEGGSILRLLEPSPLYDDIKAVIFTNFAELSKLRESLSSSNEELSSLVSLLRHPKHWLWAKSVAMSRPFIMVSPHLVHARTHSDLAPAVS